MAKKKVITIKMPKRLLALWLTALRSGKYERGKRRLCTIDDKGNKSYCCLGVLQMVAEGQVECYGFSSNSKPLPTIEWLRGHGIEFGLGLGRAGGGVLSNLVSPHLPLLGTSAHGANDSGKFTFAEIADAIEKHAEGY